MAKRYENITETVGNTPVVKNNRLAPEGVDLYVKIEAFNPLGSVKDRLALGVIEGLTKVFYPEASSTVVFVIMALVLLLRPAGLFGREK